MEAIGGGSRALSFVVVAGLVVAAVVVTALVFPFAGNGYSSTTSSAMDGVVTGSVTVGPSQPVCTVGQPCTVNMTGYSVVFTPECVGPAACVASEASLSPSGHYSALLPAGVYAVTGLYPSCPWLGCSTTFPKTVVVEVGVQTVLDFQIDTGLR